MSYIILQLLEVKSYISIKSFLKSTQIVCFIQEFKKPLNLKDPLICRRLQLTDLPIFIGKLIALTELIVRHNSMIALPQTIVNLRNLKVLISSNNDLLYLPGSITNMRLKILDISRNDFFISNIICIHTRLLTLRSLAAKVILKNRFVSFTFFLLSTYVACAPYCSKYNTTEIIILSTDQYMTNISINSTRCSRISKKRNIVFIARTPASNLT